MGSFAIGRLNGDLRLRATVSGSFRQAMGAVQNAVYALTDHGVDVLSPADPRVVDQVGEFLFVASDRLRTIKPVQNRHLAAIAASDFLWVVVPDGYVGLSVAMEIGYATAVQTPIYSDRVPDDLTLSHYVTVVSSLDEMVRRAEMSKRSREPDTVLLDPHAMVENAHNDLEVIMDGLTQPQRSQRLVSEAAAQIQRRIISPLT